MKDTATPLTDYCLRALVDKTYEKRKWAAGEIEKTVKKVKSLGYHKDLDNIIDVLSSLALSINSNNKKGGAIGLASVAVAIGRGIENDMIEKIIRPILSLFDDQESQVRYYACEALYNILKIAEEKLLPFFEDIFDKMVKFSADFDLEIRNSVDAIDMILKTTIETAGESFDVTILIQLLRERILTKNLLVKQYIMTWIHFLKDRMLHVGVLLYLPDLLDGIFNILSEANEELRKQCEDFLQYYSRKIIQNPSKVDFSSMINILIIYTNPDYNDIVRHQALTWLDLFLNLSPQSFDFYISGLLAAILVCFSPSKNHSVNNDSLACSSHKFHKATFFNSESYDMKKLVENINQNLMKLVTSNQKNYLKQEDNDQIIDDSSFVSKKPFKLSKINNVLIKNLEQGTSPQVKIAVLNWIIYLEAEIPKQFYLRNRNDLFPLIVDTLEDKSEEVTNLTLQILAKTLTSPLAKDVSEEENDFTSITNKYYFNKFINTFLIFLKTNTIPLETKGTSIIRQLCNLISPEDIYLSLSLNIYNDSIELEIKHMIIQILNKILLTSSELFKLRMILRTEKNKKAYIFFTVLYKTWCLFPSIVLPLCYLSKNYKLAYNLIIIYSQKGDITLEFLNEIDKLIQLIESPIFAYLRIDFLNDENYYLRKSLYGLMMLLPQSKAFHVLRKRIECVPNFKDDNNTHEYKDPIEEHKELSFFIDIFEENLVKNQKNTKSIKN